MESQISERELTLISQIELDDDEIALIRASGDEMYDDVKKGWKRCDLQFAYYLVDIGMRYYDDRKYWEEFWNSIGCKQNVNKQGMIGDFFIATLRRYNLPVFNLSGMHYVGNILAHGFIPNKYSSAFFDFLYSFYNVALRGTVPDDLSDAMYIIAQVFSDPEFSRTYPELRGTNLIKSTCNVLCDETLFGTVVKKMIRRIGNSYDSLDDVRLGVYEEQFRHWAENHDRRRSRDRIGGSPYLECDKERVVFNLIIPPRAADNQHPVLTLKSSDGSVICTRRLNASERFGIHIIDDEQPVEIPDPFDEFTVWMDGNCIFSNTNDGYILFNKNGRSHRKVSLGFNLVVARKSLTEDLQGIEFGDVGEDGKLYGFMMGPTDSVQIGGHRFTVEKTIDESIRISTPVVDAQCRDQDGNSYLMFDRLPSLRIFVNRENRDASLDVTCGMNRVHIERLASLCDDGFGGDADVGMDLASSGLREEAGVYSIMLNGSVKARFLMIPGFRCTFEEHLYTTAKESTFEVTGFDETYHFDTMDGQVHTAPMVIDGREFVFGFQVPSNRYRIDEQPWRMFGNEMYFREAQGSKLFIYSPISLFPRIKVDGFQKSFELGVEGNYLVFDFCRIAMLSRMIEASTKKWSVLKFCCGDEKIFSIRYTADYTYGKGAIIRKDAPPNTWAVVENVASGEKTPFEGDQCIVNDTDDLRVWEYYDAGFGSDRREAMFLKRSIDVEPSLVAAIISGEYVGRVDFAPGGMSFDAKYFRNLIRIDGMYDPESDLRMFKRNDPSDDKVAKYLMAYDAVRRVLINDVNIDRLRKRIVRFSTSDPELAIQLCDAYLKRSPNSDIRERRAELEEKLGRNNADVESPEE